MLHPTSDRFCDLCRMPLWPGHGPIAVSFSRRPAKNRQAIQLLLAAAALCLLRLLPLLLRHLPTCHYPPLLRPFCYHDFLYLSMLLYRC